MVTLQVQTYMCSTRLTKKINVVGINDPELTGLIIVTDAVALDVKKGPFIGIFHEYAHLGKGNSIHASGQLEWFKTPS